MLAPFYSLRELIGIGLPRLPIRRVLIGPSVHKQLNLESGKALLFQNGYTDVQVLVSNTSYRG